MSNSFDQNQQTFRDSAPLNDNFFFSFTGFLYYSDWGNRPHIGKCGLDGSGRHWLTTSKNVGWPNGLSLCQITKRLFWVDAKLDVIESCDRNGQNRVQLTKLYAPHPFAISVFEDFVYWTDWMTMAVHRAHRLTGLQHTVLLNSSHRLMGLQVICLRICPCALFYSS